MRNLDINGKKDHGSTGSSNNCDTCGEAITAIVTTGPNEDQAAPCGHDISRAYIGNRRVVTDGGLDPCPACGQDPEECYRCQNCGHDLAGRSSTAGREAMER